MNGMKIDKPTYLPQYINWHGASNPESLSTDLSQEIGQLLSQTLLLDRRASMAVSGGRTPIPLFEKLSKLKLDWSKIDLTLADERWVEKTHKDSNELLVRRHLFKNNASHATFTPLMNSAKSAKEGQIECENVLKRVKQPFDVIVLGMGNDGHTASLFPCCAELVTAMNSNSARNCIATMPKSAPYQRISLTYSTISNANNIILHIEGQEKLNTLKLAMKNKDPSKMPIYAFLNQPLSIYWSPN